MKRARVMAFALGLAIAILVEQPRPSQLRRPGDNGPAIKAQINAPAFLALDARGNIYVYEDIAPGAIRRIDRSTHRITTVAVECDPDGKQPVLTGCFGAIEGLQVTDSGNLLFLEFISNRVSSYDRVSHRFTVIAGNGAPASKGDGGQARDASLAFPNCLGLDHNSDVFVCDSNYSIRRIESKTGIISTVAGNGKRGFAGDGGPALNAQFDTPGSVAVDRQGNIFVADATSNRIRRVDANTGIIETYAGIDFPPATVWRFSGCRGYT